MSDKLLKTIEEKYKLRAVSMNEDASAEVQWIPTDILALDLAMGKGLPLGRIIELYGHESSGKSTIAIKAIAAAMRQGKRCAYIDMEHAFDPMWAGRLGVDCDKLTIYQPDYGEQALDITCDLVSSGEFSIVVVDSVASLVPKVELEGSIEDKTMGLQARMMSQALRKLQMLAASGKCTVIFINQIRKKIGVMYGNPDTTPGGEALKFYSSIRISVTRVNKSDIKIANDEIIAHRIKIVIPKNKVGSPFKQREFLLHYDLGADNYEALIDHCIGMSLITQAGPSYKLIVNNETISYKGKKALMKAIKKTPEVLDVLIKAANIHEYYLENIKADVDYGSTDEKPEIESE